MNTLITIFIMIWCKENILSNCQLEQIYDLRLVNGSDLMGIVEVFYNDTWGTICDDSFGNKECQVVCRQLKNRGGLCLNNKNDKCIKNTVNELDDGLSHIWLDEIKCSGVEREIGECMFGNWGGVECKHEDNVGCICEAPRVIGECEWNRHRIVPFDPSHRGIGFVEVQELNGEWHGICDDEWGIDEVYVFCNCLGYTNDSYFQALTNVERNVDEYLLDGIDCSVSNRKNLSNIWDCGVNLPIKSMCDPKFESAAVFCEPILLTTNNKEDVEHSVSCQQNEMTICLKVVEDLNIVPRIYIRPACPSAVGLPFDSEKGFCYQLNLNDCKSFSLQNVEELDHVIQHYCINIYYDLSEEESFLYDILNSSKLIARSGCCGITRSMNVSGKLLANNYITSPAISVVDYNLDVTCYTDSGFSQLTSSSIEHGEMIYCKVKADLLDTSLLLVVDTCSFLSNAQDDAAKFVFIKDRCSQVKLLNILYYNLGNLEWGFGIRIPKFESSHEIYLTCHARLCSKVDNKETCDRSCHSKTIQLPSSNFRYRRSAEENAGRNSIDELGSGHDVNGDEKIMSTIPSAVHQHLQRDKDGDVIEDEFVKKDNGEVEQVVESDHFNVVDSPLGGPVIDTNNVLKEQRASSSASFINSPLLVVLAGYSILMMIASYPAIYKNM